ncbi:MAG: hypothetical protein NVS2B14_07900 [Chamaesiphon sp.]
MTPSEIEAALQAAFHECDAVLCPLTQKQKQILLQVVAEELTQTPTGGSVDFDDANTTNPLKELMIEQRQALLEFVKEQERQNRSWKIKLLNDWLHNRDSGSVQFIRDRYGLQWLNRIKPVHLSEYFEQEWETVRLKVGDRIEVANSLWEWVQENGPCSQQWFPCTVVGVSEATEGDREASSEEAFSYTNCLIRFDRGMEYEIQGIYEWNRYNWRWPPP